MVLQSFKDSKQRADTARAFLKVRSRIWSLSISFHSIYLGILGSVSHLQNHTYRSTLKESYRQNHTYRITPTEIEGVFAWKQNFILKICIWQPFLYRMSSLSVYLLPHVPGACGVGKTALDPLELTFQMGVSCHAGGENVTESSGRATNDFNSYFISPALVKKFNLKIFI